MRVYCAYKVGQNIQHLEQWMLDKNDTNVKVEKLHSSTAPQFEFFKQSPNI